MAMNEKSFARVHYFPRQFLRREDFVDEQVYHLATHRRHNIAGHSWGILFGLTFLIDEDDRLYLEPGLATDGFGRDLVVDKRQEMSALINHKEGDRFDIWLEYQRESASEAPAGYDSCAEKIGQTFYRWQEEGKVVLREPETGEPARRRPEAVDPGDRDFPPTRVAPDQPEKGWPVFLGQLVRDPDTRGGLRVDLAGRPHAGLVGEAVRDPAGRGYVELGAEAGNGRQRFAVFLAQPKGADGAPEQQEGAERLRFAVLDNGEATLHGDTDLHGHLTVDGAIEFTAPTDRASLKPPGEAEPRFEHCADETTPVPAEAEARETAHPWRIYHYTERKAPPQPGEEPVDPICHELRVEMAETKPGCQVVVGAWSTEAGAFKPGLTVRSDSTVVVHGDLVLEGLLKKTPGAELEERQKRVPGQTTQRTEDTKQGVFQAGMVSVDQEVAAFFEMKKEEAKVETLQQNATIGFSMATALVRLLGGGSKTVGRLSRWRTPASIALLAAAAIAGNQAELNWICPIYQLWPDFLGDLPALPADWETWQKMCEP